MNPYQRSHLSEENLLASAAGHTGDEARANAHLLADLAEIEERRLHLKRGHGSMVACCVAELGHSDHEAYHRIGVARLARRFPVIFEMIADGRQTLSSIKLLSRHLAPETADDLLDTSAHMSKSQIQHLLAQRFPNPWFDKETSGRLGPDRVGMWNETPIAPGVYELRVVYGQETHDKLLHQRNLLSHQVPSGDMGEVLDRSLEIAIRQTEKRRFAAAGNPRGGTTASASRHIPAEVQRAVIERDGGKCSYVAAGGKRCGSEWQLEFDHREAFAQGGEATVDNVRLLCRAHNQYMAECTYGPGFMHEKRRVAAEAAARAADVRIHSKATADRLRNAEAARRKAAAAELLPALRALGFRADEARERADLAANVPEAPLELRVKIALSGRRACGPVTPPLGRPELTSNEPRAA
jgi:5-methylcytosine-specific restriction endonuclease McrA